MHNFRRHLCFSLSCFTQYGIQSKVYLSDITLGFYMIKVHKSEQKMASPTTNSINNTPKNKVPGSINQNERFLEYVIYIIIFNHVILFFV
jgi:K+-transporting ATPase A subunit